MLRRLSPLTFLLALVAGCGEPPPPPLNPLTGTITHDGQPVTQGGLIFIPESGSWGGVVVNAAVGKDGTFSATTSRTTGMATTIHNGAPAGRYKVVYHPPSDGQKMGLETELPEVVVVEAGVNEIKLVLPEKRVEEKREP